MSMNSEKVDSAQKADPLEILKAWESGDFSCRLSADVEPETLDHTQRSRLWKLLSSKANPGTISYQLPR